MVFDNKTKQQKILLVNKPQGKTPFQVIEQIYTQLPQYQNTKMSYAGRLDPMADGLLVLLLGDENKRRKAYEELPKEYKFTALFGVATDTYDLLGKITNICTKTVDIKDFAEITKSFVGTLEQPYPPYSSMHVNGKPLYYYARQNKLNEIILPKKKITIDKFSYISSEVMNKKELENNVIERITIVQGDFRQEEILNIWLDFFDKTEIERFLLSSFTITCSSGTYVRGIVQTIGEKLDSCAVTYSITRNAVGEFKLKDALTLKK